MVDQARLAAGHHRLRDGASLGSGKALRARLTKRLCASTKRVEAVVQANRETAASSWPKKTKGGTLLAREVDLVLCLSIHGG